MPLLVAGTAAASAPLGPLCQLLDQVQVVLLSRSSRRRAFSADAALSADQKRAAEHARKTSIR
jgi:hypothetical protein